MMNVVTDVLRLRGQCLAVPEGEDVSQLAEDMSVAMYIENGIGLAAPQVGVNKRIIVMDPTSEGTKTSLFVMINPEITRQSALHEWAEEGCLSLPGVVCKVPRPVWVDVKYRSLSGAIIEVRLTGLAARVVQHEIDHLDGKLMNDFGAGAI